MRVAHVEDPRVGRRERQRVGHRVDRQTQRDEIRSSHELAATTGVAALALREAQKLHVRMRAEQRAEPHPGGAVLPVDEYAAHRAEATSKR